MKKSYNLFYVPEKPDFEIFSRDLTMDMLAEGNLEFDTEKTEDEFELHLILKSKGEKEIFAYGFPDISPYIQELLDDLNKLLDLKQVVLVVGDEARYTFELSEKSIKELREFIGADD